MAERGSGAERIFTRYARQRLYGAFHATRTDDQLRFGRFLAIYRAETCIEALRQARADYGNDHVYLGFDLAAVCLIVSGERQLHNLCGLYPGGETVVRQPASLWYRVGATFPLEPPAE